jgi:hypothetical protein
MRHIMNLYRQQTRLKLHSWPGYHDKLKPVNAVCLSLAKAAGDRDEGPVKRMKEVQLGTGSTI